MKKQKIITITNVDLYKNYFQDAVLVWHVSEVVRFCEIFVWAIILANDIITTDHRTEVPQLIQDSE